MTVWWSWLYLTFERTDFMNMQIRPRRLRSNDVLRKMVRETRVDKSSLIYPMFVIEGSDIKEEIPSMAGQYRYSIDRMGEKLESLSKSGIGGVMLFGIPANKDEVGSGAYAQDGIVQKAFREAKKNYPDLYLIGDVCMCEYTSHGHCGVLCDNDVDNDKTLELLSKTALSQVQAGADMVAPSDMMDGRVRAIRNKLDENGYINTPIMSYAVKFASAYYGPFRDAADDHREGGQLPRDRRLGGLLRAARKGPCRSDRDRVVLRVRLLRHRAEVPHDHRRLRMLGR